MKKIVGNAYTIQWTPPDGGVSSLFVIAPDFAGAEKLAIGYMTAVTCDDEHDRLEDWDVELVSIELAARNVVIGEEVTFADVKPVPDA